MTQNAFTHTIRIIANDAYFSAQNDNLQIHEEKSKGVYVKGLTDYYVGSASEVYEIMRQGGMARVVTATSKSTAPPQRCIGGNRSAYFLLAVPQT